MKRAILSKSVPLLHGVGIACRSRAMEATRTINYRPWGRRLDDQVPRVTAADLEKG